MDSKNIDTVIANKESIAYIDFAFKVPYYEKLVTNYSELQEIIANAMAVKKYAHCICVCNKHYKVMFLNCSLYNYLTKEAIKRTSIKVFSVGLYLEEPQKSDSNNLQIRGYFTCLDIHREIYLSKWRELVQRRILSREFLSFLKKGNESPNSSVNKQRIRMAIMQMKVQWTTENIVNGSEINAQNEFEEYQKFVKRQVKYNDEEKDNSPESMVSDIGNSLNSNVNENKPIDGELDDGNETHVNLLSDVTNEEDQLRLTF